MSASTYIYQVPGIPECHRHDFPQLVVGIHGNSKMEMENEEILMDGTVGCIIPPGITHQYTGMGDNRSMAINFDSRYSSNLVKRLSQEPRAFSLDRSMRIFLSFSAMELPEFKGSPDVGRDSFSQHIITVFTDLLKDRIFNLPKELPTLDLSRIDSYITRRMHRKITTEDLAGLVNISPSHFYTLFKKETGETPYQYVINRRLEEAKQLLINATCSITDVAFETGFSSQSAMSNTFKKHLGCTPGGFKRSVSHRVTCKDGT